MDETSPGCVTGIVLGIVTLIALIVVACTATFVSIPPDKIALHYTGGPIQGTHYVGIVQPGTGTQFFGLQENIYKLPATQRNYIFSRGETDGDKAGVDYIAAPSIDNVQFTFEAALYFKLNTDPDTMRQFFEQICLHDACWDLGKGKGWDQMLNQYFRPQVENAIRLEAGKYTREQLYRDPDTLVKMQNDIASALKDRVNAALGGEFFCGPDSNATTCTNFGVTIKNPLPPDSVVQAYADSAAAEQNVVTATNNGQATVAAAKAAADAQTARAQAQALTQAQIDYINAQAALACAQNTNAGACTMVVTNGGTGLNVNVK